MHSSLVSSFLFALVLIVVLATITALGAFGSANLLMVDRLFQWFPNQPATPPILLVSTTEAERNSPAALSDLVSSLHRYKPRAIFLLGQEAQSGEQIPPGVTLVDSTSRLEDARLPESELPDPAAHSFLTPVLIGAGHYRLWQESVQLGPKIFRGFQAGLGPAGESDPAIVDFSMDDGFIPLVKASRVLDQGLTPALIEDKFVLVGDALKPGLPGFAVPLRQERGFSLLELQGYVLNSVISGRLLDFSGFISTVIGTLLIGILSTLLFQWLPSHRSAIFALAICLFIVALQWAAVKFTATILPAWELIVAQLANLMAVHQLQRNREEQALNRIIARTNSRLSERVQPVNFNRSDDPWKKIISFVNQQLNIKRSIFLEKVPADHRVKEIEALNCSIDDISERRRDYEREPYSVALEANAPIQPFRDYFTEVVEGEVQYVVPLSFGGEVQGFWALSLMPAKNWNKVAFESNARSFSIQIAELLYHRHHWHRRLQKAETSWRKLLSVEVGLNLHRQLRNTVDLLEHRLDILEDVMNGLSTAVVVYDVFGQVLHTNGIIEHLARENDVAVYQLTAMELLAQSNDIPLDEARNKLRYVTLKHQTLVQSSTLFSNRGSYLLYIRPLLVKEESTMDQVQPFEIRGILFEFADLTQVRQHDEIRQDISDQYFSQLRDNLSSISFAADNLASIGFTGSDLARQRQLDSSKWLSTIADTANESGRLTERVEAELRNQIHMREQTVPTNIAPIIARQLERAQESIQGKDLSFDYRPPESNSLNFVEPKTFEQLISALVNLLIHDADHGTAIRVAITTQDRENIHVLVKSNGHGLPQEQLDQTLATYKSYLDISEDPLTRVSVLAQQVLLWGGETSFRSGIGSGFSVDIRLKTFNLSVSEVGSEDRQQFEKS